MNGRSFSMHAIVVACAFALSTATFAQSPPKDLQSPPKDLQPLPDVPPPPRLGSTPLPDDPDEPSVTIRQAPEGKVEEFRSKDGHIYAIRVTPKVGKPYLLVDPDGKGTATKAEEIGSGIRPAQWTILEF